MEPKIKFELPPQLPERSKVAIDTEFFGMPKGRLHRPVGTFACLQICPDGKTVYIVTEAEQIPESLKRIEDGYWIMHNAKFDVKQLRRYADVPPRQKLHDIMLAEQVMYSGYYTSQKGSEGFSLSGMARRYLRTVLDKEAREQFEEATELSEELLHYAAMDAAITWKIADKQRPKMDHDDRRIYHYVDLPALWAVLDFEGFKLDQERWGTMADEREAEANAIAEELGFNPGSWQQTLAALEEEGFSPPNTQAATLEKLKSSKIAPKVIEYRQLGKLATTYGRNWFENDVESDGKVYSDFWIIGAKTGRMSSSKPNMQNIPIREHPEYREAFIASDENHRILVADFSAQEVRVLAELSRDKRLIHLFRSMGPKDNIYVLIAQDVFDQKIEKGTQAYDDTKALVLGTNYGMSVWGLAKKMGVSENEADRIQKKFFRRFPGVRRYMFEQSRAIDVVTTPLGRKYWTNPHSFQNERNVLNSPIQGGAGDQIKLALGIMHRRWEGDTFPVVNVVHDEIVADVHDIDVARFSSLMREAMIESGKLVHPSVPAVADVGEGANWLEAKGD